MSYTSKYLIFITFLLSFIGTSTNLFPFSFMYFPLLIGLFFLSLNKNYIILNKLTLILLLSFIYFSLSALISGIPLYLLFSYPSLRYDANFFVSYVPLFIFSAIPYRFPFEKIIDLGLKGIFLIDLIFLFIYLKSGGTIFFYEPNIYHFLFKTHNAAGGFFSIMTSISLGLYLFNRRFIYLIITIAFFVSLLLTDSRGSIIAFLLGTFSFFLYYRNKKKLFLLSLFLPVLLLTVILLYTYPVWVSLGKPVYSHFTVPGVPSLNIERGGTIYARIFYHWPKGLYLFFQSPFLGIGFTRYNDIPYNLQTELPGITLNESRHIHFNSSHAHNSYIHFLAETGIFGLILILLLLYYIFNFNCEIYLQKYKYIIQLLVLVVYFSGFVEHRVTTPAEIIPFTLTVGLIISYCNYLKYLRKRFRK